MSTTQFAIIVGIVLAAVAFFGGFLALLTSVGGGALGWLVALIVSGRIDLREVVNRSGDRR